MEKLWYYGKKLRYYGLNNGTMDKTMVLYRKLPNFDLRREKNMVDYPKQLNNIASELRFTME